MRNVDWHSSLYGSPCVCQKQEAEEKWIKQQQKKRKKKRSEHAEGQNVSFQCNHTTMFIFRSSLKRQRVRVWEQSGYQLKTILKGHNRSGNCVTLPISLSGTVNSRADTESEKGGGRKMEGTFCRSMLMDECWPWLCRVHQYTLGKKCPL